MTAANDFNHKVALASGLRDLQSGRLRQAEEQFRYLVAHFPASGGGYRGLAKVHLEQNDRPAALATLRAGAASLAKAGDRSGAIALLREAIPLGPSDAAVHRHLAAALILAGDPAGAALEHRRFARAAIAAGDREAALRELRYALAASGADPTLRSLAVEYGLPVPGSTAGPGAGHADPAPPPAEPMPEGPAAPAADRPVEDDPPGESADRRAGRFIAERDPRAAQAAFVAAREHLAAGHANAASDLLLQAIAAGLADHQTQRLLVEVATSIGKKDLARAKCALLAEALRLDGQAELAVEVERLAEAV